MAFLRPSGLPDAVLSKVWREGTNGTGEMRDRDGLKRVLSLAKDALEEEEVKKDRGLASSTPTASSTLVSGGSPSILNVPSKPMTDKDKAKYEKHFSSLDVNKSGMVTTENAVTFLGKASLPERIREIVRKRSRGR